jgi:uncharacterized membrane protein
MSKGRLEAFSDGVFAVIITIMVFNIKVPQSGSFVARSTAATTTMTTSFRWWVSAARGLGPS